MALLSLSQFVAKYSGKFVEYHSFDPRAKFQCVDLANAYIVEALGLTPIIGTNAQDFPSKKGKEWEYILNTPTGLPQKGDLMIFKSADGVGHISIFLEGNLNLFKSFDQNYPTGSACKTVQHNYKNVLGWMRPVKSTQGSMSEELQACLKQHTQLVTELEAEKRKTSSLIEETKQKDAEIERLRGEKAEQASIAKTTKEEMAQFMEALATKLTSIVDKSAIIGSVDRLISEESEYIKKVKELENAYDQLVDRKHDEIEALKRSIEELKAVNEKQAKHISTLETRLTNLEHGEVKQKTLLDLIQDLFTSFRRK